MVSLLATGWDLYHTAFSPGEEYPSASEGFKRHASTGTGDMPPRAGVPQAGAFQTGINAHARQGSRTTGAQHQARAVARATDILV